MRARQPVFTRSSVAWAAAALLGSLAATPASAATCTWNPAAGSWNTAASWSCGFVPGNLDMAVIAAGKAVTVSGAQPTTSVSNDGTVTITSANLEGLEAISHLLDRMDAAHRDLRTLRERLQRYEDGGL